MKVIDMQTFIKVLETHNEIITIDYEVDPILEITEIVDRISKSNGPAILFTNPKGSKIPILINSLGSLNRLCLALGIKDINEIKDEIKDIITVKPPQSLIEGIKLFPKYGSLLTYHPKTVTNAKCQEVICTGLDINLNKFPILKCWPEDGGKYITLPLVITKNYKTGLQNLGMYRMQVYDKRTTGMHWHKHHDGAKNFDMYKDNNKRMEIAVALGGPPSLIIGTISPLPPFIDEITFSCFLSKSKIKMVKAKTVDLKVPADAEIILEGYIDPSEELKLEGPFGDHTGFYSLADDYPVFHITAITHKKDVIYPTTIVGIPPMEDTYIGKAIEKIFLPMLQLFIPEIIDMNFPKFGTFHNFVFISIKKRYPFHAKKVMNAVWGMGQLMLTKFIVIVDHDIDVQNEDLVLWALSNNVDPKRDTMITEGPLDVLDHSSPYIKGGAKMGFDATRRFKEEQPMREYPNMIKMNQDVKDKIDKIWSKLFKNDR